MRPYEDPGIPHPGRTYYAGRWRTPEQIESCRVRVSRAQKKYVEKPENYQRVREYNRNYLVTYRTTAAYFLSEVKRNAKQRGIQ